MSNTHEESYRWQRKEESSDRYTPDTRRNKTSIRKMGIGRPNCLHLDNSKY